MKQLKILYFNFNGRLNRLRYFLYDIPLSIIMVIAYFIAMNKIIIDTSLTSTYIYIGIYYMILIICSISKLTLTVRRLHDLNKTGWLALIQLLYLIPFIRIVSGIFVLYLLFAPGTDGENKYGDNPLNYDYYLTMKA
ncbi:DUF805 domain-containing protein [Vallitalea maricola]|uniref:Uncharacterized protein n=1 Tax=Vallitalea maricola TaxID=3074433 RepID=A0ACB5UFQ1_9FIRM|nr:hypothetical protein AN2V17_10030 [Vallitalea sp. AN17-2]